MKTTLFPKRAVHLDFHTMPGIRDIGREFKAEDFAATLARTGVDYINVFAKCNLGFAYYPTKIGLVYPGLKKDLLGGMVAACRKRGIKVVAYFNTGLDHEAALRRRDWCKLNQAGQAYEMDKMSHFFRKMCLNTDYRKELLGIIGEVLDRYPVDGIFLDCISAAPCYGVECLDGMKRRGVDVFDEEAATNYAWEVIDRFQRDVNALVTGKRKGINVYFNGTPYCTQPTHVEMEILPTGGWGYEVLPFAVRYARTLGKPYLTMTGRFHKSWGDFGGLRTYHSLLFDCYNSIANGGACMVGDHLHPRGRLDKAVYELIGRVYAETKKFDAWTDGQIPVAELAVVEPAMKGFPGRMQQFSSVAGATRMLSELKQQFDVIDGNGDLRRYKGLVLPDTVTVDTALGGKLSAHLKRGGFIISSGRSGLNPDSVFALKEHGLTNEGPEPCNPAFFRAGEEVAAGIPDMPVTIYSRGIAVTPKKGTAILADLWQPYFNHGDFDRRHEYLYTPPQKSAGRPALTRCGSVFHFAFPVFSGYFDHAVVAYKQLVANCLCLVHPSPLIRAENLPSFAQVTVARQERRTLVHILTYLPELRGPTMQAIEEPMEISNAVVSLRTGGRKTTRVYSAPSRESLAWKESGGYLSVKIPSVRGYHLVVVE